MTLTHAATGLKAMKYLGGKEHPSSLSRQTHKMKIIYLLAHATKALKETFLMELASL